MFKKLLKFIFKTLAWLVGLLLIIIVLGYLTMGLWIKPLIGFVVPKITQTSASLEQADISLLSGRLALKGLKIGNPAGFSEPYVFELGEFAVEFQPKSILTNKIIVNKILIKGTQITAEINQMGQTNLLVLNNNVQSKLNAPPQKKAINKEKTATTKSTKTVVIKDLQILDTKLNFAMMGHTGTLTLPNIQEKNIGEKKNLSLKESIQLLFDKLTLEPINEMQKSTQKMLKGALDKISSKINDDKAIKSLSETLSNIF
jgi:uncharacterized protein involved in outer membrane biogenesis